MFTDVRANAFAYSFVIFIIFLSGCASEFCTGCKSSSVEVWFICFFDQAHCTLLWLATIVLHAVFAALCKREYIKSLATKTRWF